MAAHMDLGMNQKQSSLQRIKRITESIIGLPTLPTVVSKMIELVDNPKTSAASLARLISTDQSLTARILKLANSAYYGFPREISTVNMAIVVMGFNAVRDMGLSLSVFDIFKDSSDLKHFDLNRFWEHSIGCGVATKMIARQHRHSLAGEAFVAGLLHDIGKVILRQYAREDFIEIMSRVVMRNEDFEDAERAVIGTDHGQIGGWLTEKWRLPRQISDAIRFHHDPSQAGSSRVLVAMVSVADHLCHRAMVGNSGRQRVAEPPASTWEILEQEGVNLTPGDIESLISEFLLELDRSDTFMSFVR